MFLTDTINENKLTFDSKIKPNFEDAHFVARYISCIEDNSIAFLKSAKYLYRKRTDGSSTLDSAWEKPGLYSDVLEYGCLNALHQYTKFGRDVPESLQITILYHLIWYIKKIVNNSNSISFLSVAQKEKFDLLLREIFSLLDEKVIMEFSLAGCWFYHRVGMLGLFKDKDPEFQIVYVTAYDHVKSMVQVSYYTKEVGLESIRLDDEISLPIFAKTINHEFNTKNFVKERRLWISLKGNPKLKIVINNKPTRISIGGKHERNGVNSSQLIKIFKAKKPNYKITEKFINSWLLMDRDIQADDNAEHLYRYIKENHPSQKIYFVLRKESHDWIRLERDDFNLIPFGTEEHENALKSCSKVISSHADHYVSNYLGPNMLEGRHYVFLQHGVIINDLSNWLNQKEKIDCFITSSTSEYNAITEDGSKYSHTKKEVILTGLPRHDSLIKSNNEIEPSILIMPTWRANIVGATDGPGNTRVLSPDFMNTAFAKHWISFLHSPKLKELAEQYQYKIVFFPHVNIAPYLSVFDIPKYIEICTHAQGGIQNLFRKCAMMITDYSSVAFDMAVQNKPTLYYQFDEDEVFSGGHICGRGYFDYRKNGFGSVVTSERNLLSELNKLLKNGAKPLEEFQRRIDHTFPFRDGNNCERTYFAISELDNPEIHQYNDPVICYDYACKATENKEWKSAIKFWSILTDESKTSVTDVAKLNLLNALRCNGDIGAAISYLNNEFINNIDKVNQDALREKAFLMMSCHQWEEAENAFFNLSNKNKFDKLNHLKCLLRQNKVEIFKEYINQYDFEKDSLYLLITDALNKMLENNHLQAANILQENLAHFDKVSLIELQPQLIIAECYRLVGMYDEAHTQLAQYESYDKGKAELCLQIGLLAYERGNWVKTANQFNSTGIEISHLNDNLVLIYIRSLRLSKKYIEAKNIIYSLNNHYLTNPDFIYEIGYIYFELEEWDLCAENWINITNSYDVKFHLAHSYRMLGMIDEAFSLLTSVNARLPETQSEWTLKADLAQLLNDWEEAIYCLSSLIRFYPETSSPYNWQRLQSAQMMKEFSLIKTLVN